MMYIKMEPIRKRLKNCFQKFSDSTNIHGVKDLFYARSVLARTFWMIVMLIAICLTIFHIYKTIGHYRNQTTMTTVKTVKEGDLLLPDLMVCYEHWVYWVDWEKVSRLGFNRETALFGLSFLSTIYSESQFNVTRARDKFMKLMAANNFTKISQFYKAIAYSDPPRLKIPEFLRSTWFRTLEFSFYEPVSLCYVTPGQQLVDDTRQRFFGSQATFVVENEPFSNFNEFINRQEYSSYLHFMLINEGLLKFKDETGRNNLTEFQVPVWIHANKKHQDGVMISSDIAAYTITVSASVRELQNRADKPCRESKRMANTDIECYFRCYSLGYYNVCNQCLPVQLAIALNVDTVDLLCQHEFILLLGRNTTVKFPRSLRYYSTEEEIKLSTSATSAPSMQKNSTNAPSSSNTESGTSHLDDNLSANVSCVDHVRQGRCKDEQCVPACEVWDFDKGVSVAMYPKSLHQIADQARTTVLINYPAEENIFVMSEVDSLTWDGLVANIGGLLGIWLGASMLSFLQMIYHCCSCVVEEDEYHFDPTTSCMNNDTPTTNGCVPNDDVHRQKERGRKTVVRHSKDELDNFV